MPKSPWTARFFDSVQFQVGSYDPRVRVAGQPTTRLWLKVQLAFRGFTSRKPSGFEIPYFQGFVAGANDLNGFDFHISLGQ